MAHFLAQTWFRESSGPSLPHLKLLGLGTRPRACALPPDQPSGSPLARAVPSQPPENVRALSITSDVAVISWSEPPRSTLNGVLKGYRVIFWSLYMDGGESEGAPVGSRGERGGVGSALMPSES